MAFERNFNQLRPYYADARPLLPPSEAEAQLLSLNLLRCAARGRAGMGRRRCFPAGGNLQTNAILGWSLL